MRAYSVWDRNRTIATVMIDVDNPEIFGELLHKFQCGTDFSDRSHLTLDDFMIEMIDKGYECEIHHHEQDFHWWLND